MILAGGGRHRSGDAHKTRFSNFKENKQCKKA
jgi:hypothetical protein